MTDLTDQQKTDFLTKLTELTRETGIVIHGCGCCGSPWVDSVEITSDQSGYVFNSGECDLTWTDPSDD